MEAIAVLHYNGALLEDAITRTELSKEELLEHMLETLMRMVADVTQAYFDDPVKRALWTRAVFALFAEAPTLKDRIAAMTIEALSKGPSPEKETE